MTDHLKRTKISEIEVTKNTAAFYVKFEVKKSLEIFCKSASFSCKKIMNFVYF